MLLTCICNIYIWTLEHKKFYYLLYTKHKSILAMQLNISRKSIWVNEVQGVYRNHSVCLPVRLYLQNRVRPKTYFWFHSGLPYFAHGCITMTQCVAHIYDPDATLTFDLKIKFIEFRHVFVSGPSFSYNFNSYSVSISTGLEADKRSIARSVPFVWRSGLQCSCCAKNLK